MTQKEFEARAIEVSIKEFEAINLIYMNCDLEKDEFCKIWCKMNESRVKAYKAEKKSKQDLEDLKWDLGMIRLGCVGLSSEIYNSYACEYFSKRQIATLRHAGIEMFTEKGEWPYEVREILSKINDYLAA